MTSDTEDAFRATRFEQAIQTEQDLLEARNEAMHPRIRARRIDVAVDAAIAFRAAWRQSQGRPHLHIVR